jgi:hypothetical protein
MKEGVTMSNVLHDSSTDRSPDARASDDQVARQQAIKQIAWLLIVAASAWAAFGNKPISEGQIKREIERQRGRRQ